jgi:hypothetical protein
MERVAFLIEETGDRLACMLNPQTVEMRRIAGIRPRRISGVPISPAEMADDPLLLTGGGMTELKLDLLFDVNVAGSSVTTTDVRDLTSPFWKLSENSSSAGRAGVWRVPMVTFFWAKSLRMTGVIAAVAERLEYFTAGGAPQRSWLRMRIIRAENPSAGDVSAPGDVSPPSEMIDTLVMPVAQGDPSSDPDLPVHQMIGSPTDGGDRLDVVAQDEYSHPSMWQWLASFNHIEDPMRVPPGTLLKTPPLGTLKGSGGSGSGGDGEEA